MTLGSSYKRAFGIAVFALTSSIAPFSHADSECVTKCMSRKGRTGDPCWAKACPRVCDLNKKDQSSFLKLSPDGQTLYMTGEVPLNDSEIVHLIDDSDEVPEPMRSINRERSKKIKFLVLNSIGGSAKTGKTLMNWVEKKGADLKVIVPDNGHCASVCAEIFRCAKNRVANKNATLMYHPPFLDGNNSDRAKAQMRKDNEEIQNSSCAKLGDQTEGGRRITAALRQEKETCYNASDLGGTNGFLEVEGGGAPQPEPASAPPPANR